MRLLTLLGPDGSLAAVERTDGQYEVKDEAGRPYRDVGDLLRRAVDWKASAEAAAASANHRLPAGLPVLRPILAPEAIVCVGLNYRKHILEMGREFPEVPTLFSKLARALTDPGAVIELPTASKFVDYEGELTIVIGRGGRNIPADQAWEAVAGLTLLNDVSMRDYQRRSLQWFAGKSWERATPVGPVVVTLDELPNLGEREIVTRVNGVERQRAPIGDLLFDIPTLIADLSKIITLRPGDLIATGTPDGVGHGMKPPSYLQSGDEVVVSLDGIGELRSRFEQGT